MPLSRPCSILIVEDERIIAKDLQQTLAGYGYDAYAIASTAEEALERATARRPDLVLMDIRIKGRTDGVTVAQVLRERFDVPVIYLTAHADDATIERANATAPYSYLLKPIKSAELRSAIEIALHRHAAEKTLRERELWYATTLRSIGDAVVTTDAQGIITFMNPAAESLTGRLLGQGQSLVDVFRVRGGSHDEMQRQSASDQNYGLFGDDADGQLARCAIDALPMMRALRGEQVDQFNLLARLPGVPQGCWYSVNAAPIRAKDGKVIGSVSVFRDVTERMQLVRHLTDLSLIDELTGLYNRRGLTLFGERQLRAAAASRVHGVMLFGDIDNMKEINDTFGHEEGDRALKDMADLLRSAFRDADILCRLGGDEFVMLGFAARPDVDALVARLHTAIETHNASAARRYRLGISIGVIRWDPEAPRSLSELLAASDALMRAEKRQHKGTH